MLYAEKVLKAKLTDKQKASARKFQEKRRLNIRASHGVGKSFLAAVCVNWFFDCIADSITITTAPTAAQVKDVLWKEIRSQRSRAKLGGLLPKAPRMEVSAEWFAVGMTAAKGEAFQGRHGKAILLVFDEAVGVDSTFFESGEGMMVDTECYWLNIYNPTDPSAKVKELEESGDFEVEQISALDHPNVIAGLAGLPSPYPGAVSLPWVEKALKNWCVKVDATQTKIGDFEFPVDSGVWYRPGPLFQGRVLGVWPTLSTNNVWSEALFLGCLEKQDIDYRIPLEVGVDVARFGDDFTTIIVRRGGVVLYHETFNGNDTVFTAGRVAEIIPMYSTAKSFQFEYRGQMYEAPQESPQGLWIKIDDDGVGGGASDILSNAGFSVERVNAGSKAAEELRYPNRRSELWFTTAEMAADFQLDFSRLLPDSIALIKRQLLAVKYKMDGRMRRVVESKDDLKKPKRLGRSPDDADALNLAFAPVLSNSDTWNSW